jgi:hypothetical protein
VDQAAWKVIRTLEMVGVISADSTGEREVQEDEIRRRLAALGYI